MIDSKHELSITRQSQLLGMSRAAVYYVPRPISEADLALQRRIDALHLEHPFAGARCCAICSGRRASKSGASTWRR